MLYHYTGLWYCGFAVLWYCGSVVLWFCGTVVLWYQVPVNGVGPEEDP